jgi:hypothetical protein
MALEGNTGRSSAADGRRLRLSHPRGFRVARFAVVLALLFAAAVYAGVAHAEDGVIVQDNTTATTSPDTSTTSDTATDPTATDPSTDPSSSPTDPSTTPTDPTTDPTTTEPPADGTATDPTSPPPGDTAPPPDSASGDPADGSDGGTPIATEPPPPVETPPVTDPVTPVVDDPSTLPPVDGTPEQSPAPPSFPGGGTANAGLPLGVQVAAPVSLDLLKIGGGASTKGRDPHLSDNGTRSAKEQSARRAFPSEGSPASSPSSAASGASGSSGGGGGVALAVEFLLAALVLLHYTRKASFILPDSLAFALREERPG